MNTQIELAIQQALKEDIGSGDVTTLAIVPEDQVINGRFLAKAPGIIAGLESCRKPSPYSTAQSC